MRKPLLSTSKRTLADGTDCIEQKVRGRCIAQLWIRPDGRIEHTDEGARRPLTEAEANSLYPHLMHLR